MNYEAISAEVGGGTKPSGHRRSRVGVYVVVSLGLVAIVAALALTKGAQIGSIIKVGKQMQAAGPPPETVGTFVAQQQTWDDTLPSIGSVAAARGVTISNDQPGVVWRIQFESGKSVKQGDVLVELDTRVERAQLASARARRELAQTNVERTRSLVSSGSISKSQLDTDESTLAGSTADAAALAAQIERKIVRAPFAGKLGIRLVNVGQYLSPGTPITVLESTDSNYVDFDLPQQDLADLHVGMPVRLTLDAKDAKATADGGAPPETESTVFAIEPDVDPSTRNIKVRATVPPNEAWLRPGMFVNVAVVKSEKTTVVAIPTTSVVHASYGDSIFVVENAPEGQGKVAHQQFVRVGRTQGDFYAILDGVQPGQEVVTAGAFKLRNGARITVNNDVQAHPELTPHPPNR